jgi:hypothetical protein
MGALLTDVVESLSMALVEATKNDLALNTLPPLLYGLAVVCLRLAMTIADRSFDASSTIAAEP